MTADAGREHRIINGLLAICIIAGFACFLLFVLPDQLKRARASDGELPRPPVPTKLSAIIPLEGPRQSPTERPHGNIVRFVPEGAPADFGNAAEEYGAAAGETAVRPGRPDDDMIEGGPGAAIDDSSAAAPAQALAYQTDGEKAPAAVEPSSGPLEGTAPVPGEEIHAGGSASPPERIAFPMSSLAHREPSALDIDPKKAKGVRPKGWLSTPPGLEADVAFWRDIYAKYDKTKVVLHHPRYLTIVYDVVNVGDILIDPRLTDLERKRMRESRISARQKEITDILLKLAEDPPASALTQEEIRIKRLFAEVTEANAFKRAAEEDGVRSQTGQRDKFIPGLTYSGRYLGEIESIFEAYGLPRELTRIIFVESMFNLRAVSNVGASGIWQFMPGTGRLYLQMNDLVDERNDPVASTHAAAKLLRHNYEELGTWPLAINAYNAGRGRLKQAVAAMGTTDIAKIIRGFSHPAYGFASRNFFLEFLAALDVAEHAEQYFGPITYDPPLSADVVRTNYTLSLPDVAHVSGIALEEILELNPALSARVAEGVRLLPSGFALRLPEKKGDLFLAAAARAPKSRTGPVTHLVRKGETLQGIARMYGVTPQAIVKSNRDMSWRVSPGQSILVPVGR